MKKQLVFSKDGNIYLDTGMPQEAFSKARLADRLGERGVKAERSLEGDKESWTFSKWAFSGSKMPDKTVLLEGFLFSGLPLSAFLGNDGKEKEFLAGARVCSAMEAASTQGLVLPRVGAGGIFISADFERILFLPEKIFDMAAGLQANEFQGFYVNKILDGNAANAFTRSVIAYRLLTGELPFTEEDEEKREEDLHDRNYLPVALRVWGLDEALARSIDKGLQQGAAKKEKGKQDRKDEDPPLPVVSLYRELGLTEGGDIASDGNLIGVIRKSNVSHEEFDRRAQRETKLFQSMLEKKRWIRRHRSLLTICAVGLFALAVVAGICTETALSRPTSQGLTETQTVEMFYSSFNTMDVLSANASSKGRNAGLVIDAMSAYFVSAKTKESYDTGSKTTSPAEWLSFNNGGSFSIYGISQFFIGNKKGEIFFTPAIRRNAPLPIGESGGMPIKKGAVKKLEVSYYFIYCTGLESEGGEKVNILKKNDIVTLTYDGKKWTVTDIEQHEGEPFSASKASLYADYKAAFDASGQDPVKAADAIRGTYEWLPLGSEILEGIEKIKSDYS